MQAAAKKSGSAAKSAAPEKGARALDKFYTRPEIAARCLETVRKFASSRAEGLAWLEPSAGSGAFFDLMPPGSVGMDLAPAHPGVVRKDFLKWKAPAGVRYVTVGNPPFGKNASLAVRFFNHAARFSEIVAFIVPRTFEKESVVRRLDPAFHLAIQEEVPLDGFTFMDEPYSVPCVFQVWERRDVARTDVERALTVPDFEFVTKKEADFAFQRVGVRAGTVHREFSDRSPSSHYFIRDTGDGRVMEVLEAIDWNAVKHRTAGNPSIAKRELVSAYVASRG